MRTLPLSEAKDTLSALVDEAQRTHEVVTITRHSKPAAVLIGVEDLESLRETVFWLSQPDLGADLASSQLEAEDGTTMSGAQLRASLGLAPVE